MPDNVVDSSAMTPEQRVRDLEEGMVIVQQKFSAMMVENADLKATLSRTKAELVGEKFRVKQLRDGLRFYAPGPFWTEVLVDTKAAEDQGKHAELVLRLTAGAEDPESA